MLFLINNWKTIYWIGLILLCSLFTAILTHSRDNGTLKQQTSVWASNEKKYNTTIDSLSGVLKVNDVKILTFQSKGKSLEQQQDRIITVYKTIQSKYESKINIVRNTSLDSLALQLTKHPRFIIQR